MSYLVVHETNMKQQPEKCPLIQLRTCGYPSKLAVVQHKLRSRHWNECHPNVGIFLMGNRIKGHLLSKEYMATDERDYLQFTQGKRPGASKIYP